MTLPDPIMGGFTGRVTLHVVRGDCGRTTLVRIGSSISVLLTLPVPGKLAPRLPGYAWGGGEVAVAAFGVRLGSDGAL